VCSCDFNASCVGVCWIHVYACVNSVCGFGVKPCLGVWACVGFMCVHVLMHVWFWCETMCVSVVLVYNGVHGIQDDI